MADIRDTYVSVYFPNGCIERTVMGVYQYDHGLKLRIDGVDAEKTFQTQFTYEG